MTAWLIARASGVTAYVLLTCAMLAGLVLSARLRRGAAAVDVHRFLTTLALGMTALHGVALTLDRTVRTPPWALVVPGASGYRPAAVAAGVLAAELAGLVVLSFSLRRRIGARNWRRLHWATYLVFVLATAHGIAAGTDTWLDSLYLGAVGAVAFATGWRALAQPTKRERTAS